MIENITGLIEKAHAQSIKSGFWQHDPDCPTLHPPTNTGTVTDPCKCENRDPLMKIVLIHSELSEALEEYRLTDEKRGGPLGAIVYSHPSVMVNGVAGRFTEETLTLRGDLFDPMAGHDMMALTLQQLNPKPEGFIVELADAAIRIFDLLGQVISDEPDSDDYFSTASYHKASTEAGVEHVRRHPVTFAYALARAHYIISECIAHYGGRFQAITIHNNLLDALSLIEYIAKSVGGDLNAAIEIKMAYNATREFKHGGKRV